jgi:predicted transcriptional regulator
MRRMAKAPKPTDAELSILEVLWDRGPSTVRQVHAALNEGREVERGYTTALKLMQILNEKGLADRDESVRPQVYRPRYSREEVQRHMVGELLDRLYRGSAKQLVMQALETKHASGEELDRIEALLDRLEGEGR